jgi:hypothetical protein
MNSVAPTMTIITSQKTLKEVLIYISCIYNSISYKYEYMEKYNDRFGIADSKFRRKKYLMIQDKTEDIIRHMLDNWRETNKLSFKEFTDCDTVNEDLQDLLMETLDRTFSLETDEDLQLTEEEIVAKLAPELTKTLNDMIFKRTAITSTPYGFI